MANTSGLEWIAERTCRLPTHPVLNTGANSGNTAEHSTGQDISVAPLSPLHYTCVSANAVLSLALSVERLECN